MILSILLYLFMRQDTDWFLHWTQPRSISARRASSAIVIDGKLSETSWSQATWSEPFLDITGRTDLGPHLETRTALVWNDTALFIAARLEEPHIWGSLSQRDTIIYHDNDFEFFFDPDGDNHRYGEIEINALNTVWDLLLEKPYRDGGPARTDWDLPGLQHAVHADGTINKPSDTDRGWTLELCIPWRDIQMLSPTPLPPLPGSHWRINFSRVQWRTKDSAGTYLKLPGREDNWVWSPIGIVNMHVPERWGLLRFSEFGTEDEIQRDAGMEEARRSVMETYHAQKKYWRQVRRWAGSIDDLNAILERPLGRNVTLSVSGEGWTAKTAVHAGEARQRFVGVTHTGRLFEE